MAILLVLVEPVCSALSIYYPKVGYSDEAVHPGKRP